MKNLMIVGTVLCTAACADYPLESPTPYVPSPSAGDDNRPNVVLIVADDLGWGDIGVNGSQLIRTPNIDALAAGGVNFTAGYVTAAVCAPSRAALLTGRHQQSFGYEFNPRGRRELGIPVEIDTVADRMRQAGYSTALIGKWHLGRVPEHHPLNRGFDHFYGFTGGGNGYLSNPEDGEYMSDPVQGARPGFMRVDLESGFDPIEVVGDLTSLLTDAAVDYIEGQGADADPFFLVLTHFAPHTPLQATYEQIAPYAHVEDQATRLYAAMVTAMDDGIGEVMDALERTGARENTLVIFTSDNGCANYIGESACSNGPFNGFKGTYFEGGIRVPMIANFPGLLPAGHVYDEPVMSIDWTVTGLAMAGAPVEEQGFDGVDLRPYLLEGVEGRPHETLFWRTLPNFTVRDGEMKLVMIERTETRDLLPMLFDLASDPGETRNLAAERPEEVERLIAEFQAWNESLPEPAWESQRSGSFNLPDGVRVTVYN
jgi:arylsulfatase A-like enzyme